jgi:hypothetical protein
MSTPPQPPDLSLNAQFQKAYEEAIARPGLAWEDLKRLGLDPHSAAVTVAALVSYITGKPLDPTDPVALAAAAGSPPAGDASGEEV